MTFAQRNKDGKEIAVAFKKIIIVLAYAFVGRALYAATMDMGMPMTSLNNALVIYDIATPVFFAGTLWFNEYPLIPEGLLMRI